MYNTPIYKVAEPRTIEVTEKIKKAIAYDNGLDLEVDSITEIDATEVLENYIGIVDAYYAEWVDANEIRYNFESDYHYE